MKPLRGGGRGGLLVIAGVLLVTPQLTLMNIFKP